MKLFGIIILTLFTICFIDYVLGWPVTNPEVIRNQLSGDPNTYSAEINTFQGGEGNPMMQVTKTMMEVPQWHCLRYFKHDIHLMRRCRNHRVPLFRKPSD